MVERTANQWVAISERLPTSADADRHGVVLVSHRAPATGERWYLVVAAKKVNAKGNTHWMRLPEHPNE